MDDVHTLKKPTSRIPVLSPVLHFVSMTVVVHLRHSFGFDYLGEKRWFVIPVWAFCSLFVIAWNTPLLWEISPPLWWFGVATVAAYLFHLLTAFIREPSKARERSKFSGKSHFSPICRAIETENTPAERLSSLYLEPALVVAIAVLCRLILGDTLLPLWLLFAGLCLFAAEFFNYWFNEVRGPTVADELKDKLDAQSQKDSRNGKSDTLKPTREEESVPRRNVRPVDEELEAKHYAKVLDMELPVRLEEVEVRFKALIKNEHGDRNAGSPEADRRSRELLEARDFFRRTLRG